MKEISEDAKQRAANYMSLKGALKQKLNCFDCNKSLEDCTCIEDTIEIKYQTKCYCGHTTYCDCGPKNIEDEK